MTNIINESIAVSFYNALAKFTIAWDSETTVGLTEIAAKSIYVATQRIVDHISRNEYSAREIALQKATLSKTDPTPKYSASEIAAKMAEWESEKWSDFLSGRMEYSGDKPRMSAEARRRFDCAKELVVASFTREGLANELPKASATDDWSALVSAWCAEGDNESIVTKELETRAKRAAGFKGPDSSTLKAMLAAAKAKASPAA